MNNLKLRFSQKNLLFALGLCPLVALCGSVFSAALVGGAVLLALIISNVIVTLIGSLPVSIKWIAHLLISAVIVCAVAIVLDRFVPEFAEIKPVFPLASVCCLILGFIAKCNNAAGSDLANRDSVNKEKAVGNNTESSEKKADVAGKNVASALVDGAVLGGAFALFSVAIGGTRQFFGSTLGIAVFEKSAGGFIVVGLMLALLSSVIFMVCALRNKTAAKKETTHLKNVEGRAE